MIRQGLKKIVPDRRDYSLLHTFGATVADVQSLPTKFTIYDGRVIPNQNEPDTRFTPPVRALFEGCTAETGTFSCGLQDNALYRPDDLYDNTPPGTDGEGRDARLMLQTLITRGVKSVDGTVGNKRVAYFNCYGAGPIDDFDAARIGIWINQSERRGVLIGTWWYPEFESVGADGVLPLPSFNIKNATLHFHLITGWDNKNGQDVLEDISWQGMNFGNAGLDYMTRAQYNALMAQPYTGAFTLTKMPSNTPIPIGWQAVVDHLIYYLRNYVFHL